LNKLWDRGGAYGQEGEEGKEEDRQEEKEVALADAQYLCCYTSRRVHGFAIASRHSSGLMWFSDVKI
jgi:hypothetical protein